MLLPLLGGRPKNCKGKDGEGGGGGKVHKAINPSRDKTLQTPKSHLLLFPPRAPNFPFDPPAAWLPTGRSTAKLLRRHRRRYGRMDGYGGWNCTQGRPRRAAAGEEGIGRGGGEKGFGPRQTKPERECVSPLRPFTRAKSSLTLAKKRPPCHDAPKRVLIVVV